MGAVVPDYKIEKVECILPRYITCIPSKCKNIYLQVILLRLNFYTSVGEVRYGALLMISLGGLH